MYYHIRKLRKKKNYSSRGNIGGWLLESVKHKVILFYLDGSQIKTIEQKIEQRNIQKNIQRDIQKKLESLSLRLTQEQMLVAAIIGSDSSVTRVEIGEQLGLSDASVNACIIALKKKGVLVRIGGKRYGEWGLVISPTTNENDKITKV